MGPAETPSIALQQWLREWTHRKFGRRIVWNTARATAAEIISIAMSFQRRVQDWMQACFGPEIAADTMERNHRFFEEAAELVQANGMTASEAHQLVDYVWGRPAGEKPQEVGGVMVTLAALCETLEIDMFEAGETELARIWTKIDKIRAKQAAKPKHSPLPSAAWPCPVCGGKTKHYANCPDATPDQEVYAVGSFRFDLPPPRKCPGGCRTREECKRRPRCGD